MENIKIEQDGNKLTFTVDLGVKGRPSTSSGKTTVLATIGRPAQVGTTTDGEAVFASMTVFKYPPR